MRAWRRGRWGGESWLRDVAWQKVRLSALRLARTSSGGGPSTTLQLDTTLACTAVRMASKFFASRFSRLQPWIPSDMVFSPDARPFASATPWQPHGSTCGVTFKATS